MILPLQYPVDPTPDEARDWLTRELAKPEYGHNWLEGFWRWLQDQFVDRVGNGTSGTGQWIVVGVVLALAIGIGWWASRARLARRVKAAAEVPVLEEQRLSPGQYRDQAARALLAGDHDGALMAAFRAMTADLIGRTVLGDQPGRTAQEIAPQIAGAFPSHAPEVRAAADWFDVAAYGLAPSPRVTRAQAEAVIALDHGIAAERPDWAEAGA